MTDSIKVQKTKVRIKTIVGEERYLQFLTDVRNPTLTISVISFKYNISQTAIETCINNLDYNDGRARQLIRTTLAAEKRVKERQKRTEQFTKMLLTFNK
jgi:hypothetical protein